MIKEILETLNEADGGYGDLGVIPSAPNPEVKKKRKDREEEADEACEKGKIKFKLKEEIDEEAEKWKAKRTKTVDKKDQTRMNQAKTKRKCSGNKTPSVEKRGKRYKVTCTPLDKGKSRETKKRAKTRVGKKAVARRQKTRDKNK